MLAGGADVPLQTTRHVTRAEPCPICHRGDWCRVSHDGRYAICNRVQSARPAKGSGSGWIHFLADGPPLHRHNGQPAEQSPAGVASVPLAPLDRRDAVYRRLQAVTFLKREHQADLLRRGFSAEEIKARGYRTLPHPNRHQRAQQVALGNPEALLGVPGFYQLDGDRGPYWTIAGSPGLLIPCLDPAGKIQALRIRPDDPPPGNGKYQWLSSAPNKNNPRKGGTGSGAPCHTARPLSGRAADGRVWIVEGEIKADLSAERLGAVVLSIPGVSLWARALPVLAELLPAGGSVVVAIDADWRDKAQVHDALWCLARACPVFGYAVEVALWEPMHKGLDDFLTAGQRPTLSQPATVPAPAWVPKISSRILADVPAPNATASITLAQMHSLLPEVLGSLCPCT
jgi:hypothetical protein